MSAIGAIFNFHNQPFREEDLRDLTALWQALRKWGPDGGRFVTNDSWGVCYQAFNTTREAAFEQQPLVARDGRMLAADVRLDNRQELFAATPHLLGATAGRATDADYVKPAQQRSGA